MKNIFTLFFSLFLFSIPLKAANHHSSSPLELWYNEPAGEWVEALPIGNGRLGAMIFGDPYEELLQLNKETLWSGGPVDLNPNPESPRWLMPLREALFAGDYAKAESISRKMQGNYTQSYLPLGDVRIRYEINGQVTDYHRELDIENSLVTTHFTADGMKYTREIFASFPDQVIVVRLRSDKKNALTLDVEIDSQLHYNIVTSETGTLVMEGRAPAHADPNYFNENPEPIVYKEEEGMRFHLICRTKTTGGEVTNGSGKLHIKNADEAILFLSMATSFNGFDKCPYKEGADEKAIAEAYLHTAYRKSYDELYQAHVTDYKSLFDRVTFTLPVDSSATHRSLPERLEEYLHGATDPQLETLYFQYNRYLLISSSRPGGIATNLQGIWNNEMRPPWSSNFTTNINAQMNYWPVEAVNLSELHTPFLHQIAHMAANGAHISRNFYGTSGWCLHHNSDIWAQTNPVGNKGKGDPSWANWQMGAPWVAQHLYEHYRFNGDKEYLRNFAWPLMKGAADFILDWLVEDNNGYLVTAPSTSPENLFIDERGGRYSVAISMTCDQVLIHDLFTNLIEASEILTDDVHYRDQLKKTLERLYPLQIGAQGQLLEWYKDFRDAEPHHRHISHLIGLYPGRQISPLTTPELAEAARRSLTLRGDEGTGWSIAWKINTWARLLEGDHAYLLFRNLLRVTGNRETEHNRNGGTYRNLFSAHPPFQIDGNFGGLAGMTEMLLQSHLDELHLLPVLPQAWQTGHIKGLRARGGYEVEMKWNHMELEYAVVSSYSDACCTIRTDVPVIVEGLEVESMKVLLHDKIYYVTTFETKKNVDYRICKKE